MEIDGEINELVGWEFVVQFLVDIFDIFVLSLFYNIWGSPKLFFMFSFEGLEISFKFNIGRDNGVFMNFAIFISLSPFSFGGLDSI